MIFPGMDPYLEHPRLWTGVHAPLIVYIRDFLQPALRPRYVASIEERVYMQGPERERAPDVGIHRRKKKTKGGAATLEADEPVVVKVPSDEIHETYVTILDTYADESLVTVIEVVSPTNKYAGPGRESYRTKQQQVLQSQVHLVDAAPWRCRTTSKRVLHRMATRFARQPVEEEGRKHEVLHTRTVRTRAVD